ncbi:MAG: hypothetical protein PQJ61_15920 [Spirochaetales bacterium]|uniref:Uncharacterized protein n=1 Tax=Candidatus Thalassospirochaeta sargassi TaxID=3119039 RepID=A0AAJ1IHG6_9SPIO|nr:hypothetical protein [Spirochaetales bacterium]
MLRELKNASQEKTGFRRIFIGDYFDLFVWYESRGGVLIGFELSYNKGVDEHSIIWKQVSGWFHARVDSGEEHAGMMKQTPVLMSDGLFDSRPIAEKFRRMSTEISRDVADLVYEKLLQYE